MTLLILNVGMKFLTNLIESKASEISNSCNSEVLKQLQYGQWNKAPKGSSELIADLVLYSKKLETLRKYQSQFHENKKRQYSNPDATSGPVTIIFFFLKTIPKKFFFFFF